MCMCLSQVLSNTTRNVFDDRVDVMIKIIIVFDVSHFYRKLSSMSSECCSRACTISRGR